MSSPSSAHLDTALQTRTSRETILGRVPEIAAKIAEGASQRDLDRVLPFEAFRLIRQSGLTTLRIPENLGGPGGTVADLVEALCTLAAADSNVAHALRTHFNFTEALVLSPGTEKAGTYLPKILSGAIFGGASAELGTARPGDITATLLRHGDSYRLNGKKYYATGTAFADYAGFGAVDEEGNLRSVLLPVTREGIHILDDWDGMGQRLTASGGVDLVDVEVFEHEINKQVLDGLVGRHTSTLRQLHLAACCAGVVRNVLSDAQEYVRRQARTTRHSHAEKATDDHFVQQITGEIAASAFAIDALIAESARALDRSAEALISKATNAEELVLESALTTAKTQVVISKLALKAAENLFEVGGGSTTSRKYNFDRHWRNIRTVLTHNPLLHKARVIGDYYLNETTTHLKEGRVF